MKSTLAVSFLLGSLLSFISYGSALCIGTAGQVAYINSTSDLTNYVDCTVLSGVVFGAGDLTSTIQLPNLAQISDFGISVDGSRATEISLPALNTFLSTIGSSGVFRLTNAPNLQTFSAPGPITLQSGAAAAVVFQNNLNLTNCVIGLTSTGFGELTIGGGFSQGLDGAVGNVSFPFLTLTNTMTVSQNGLNRAPTLSLSLPLLTTAFQMFITNNSLFALNIPSAFTVTDTFKINSNPVLQNVVLNPVSLNNIDISSNGRSGGPTYYFNFDGLTRVPLAISIIENYGLTSLSFAGLIYVDNAVSFTNNYNLQSFNLPKGVISNAQLPFPFTFNGNGAAAAPLNAVIGIQNTTYGGVQINTNSFRNLYLPQLVYINGDFQLTGNTFSQGAFVANTTFYVTGSFSLINSIGTPSIYDVSGLAGANTVAFTNNQGTSTTALRFTQLYVANSIDVSGNTISSVTFGNLGFIGTLVNNSNTYSNNVVYTQYTTSPVAGGTTAFSITGNTGIQSLSITSKNPWSTQALSIADNTATTVDLTKLSEAAYVTITGNAITTITAPDLTCAGAVSVTASALSQATFSSLGSTTQFQINRYANPCSATVGSTGTASCSTLCSTCQGTNTTCPSINSQLQTALCGSSPNIFSSSACRAPTFAAYSTTGASLTPNSITSAAGGTGSPTTATGTNGNTNNNGGTVTGPAATTASGTVTTPGDGATGSVTSRTGGSSLLSASIFLVLSLALLLI